MKMEKLIPFCLISGFPSIYICAYIDKDVLVFTINLILDWEFYCSLSIALISKILPSVSYLYHCLALVRQAMSVICTTEQKCEHFERSSFTVSCLMPTVMSLFSLIRWSSVLSQLPLFGTMGTSAGQWDKRPHIPTAFTGTQRITERSRVGGDLRRWPSRNPASIQDCKLRVCGNCPNNSCILGLWELLKAGASQQASPIFHWIAQMLTTHHCFQLLSVAHVVLLIPSTQCCTASTVHSAIRLSHH